jgi:hypothetical protein
VSSFTEEQKSLMISLTTYHIFGRKDLSAFPYNRLKAIGKPLFIQGKILQS